MLELHHLSRIYPLISKRYLLNKYPVAIWDKISVELIALLPLTAIAI